MARDDVNLGNSTGPEGRFPCHSFLVRPVAFLRCKGGGSRLACPVTMTKGSMLRARRLSYTALSCCVLLLFCACNSFRSGDKGRATRSDRLMAAYPSLRSGRFVVIADFEDPKHMEIVQLVSVSPEARCVLNRKKGRKETGLGCLALTAGSANDTVVINNDHAEHWYFKRDWRQYDLLLLSVHVPRRDFELDLSIAAGASGRRMGVRSKLPLERGWNTLRIDLAEVAEHLPLDDVQEIRLAVTGIGKPTRIYFDDLILTGSRQTLFGDTDNRSGDLYVQRVGRRWIVGAGGRFSLTFANGQIVAWHNTATDPYRQQNLVRGTTLGPSPVVVEPLNQPNGDFSALGRMVIASPRILEMNATRVVLACDWRFVDDPDEPLDDRPFQQWLYTIYPTGQVYVTTTCTAATRAWSADELGLAVTIASTGEDQLQTHAALAARANGAPAHPAHGSARIVSNNSYLLYVLGDTDPSSRMIVQWDRRQQRASFVALTEAPDSDIRRWRCQLLLASANEVSEQEALERAIDFGHPAVPTVEVGSIVGVSAGRANDPNATPVAAGVRLAPDGGLVRFVIDGTRRPRFSPAFEIVGAQHQEAWVYVNNLIFDATTYNNAGNLLFQLPDVIRGRTTVEVLFRKPTVSDGS